MKRVYLRNNANRNVLQPRFLRVLQPMKILIVDDERKMVTAVQQGLESEGYLVRTAFSFEEADSLLLKENFDLLLLDIMLPGKNGLALLRRLRSEGLRMPVLLLTALDSVEDRVLGLDAGGDDYLIKPFAFSELLARVRALLRRMDIAPCNSLDYGDLHLDLSGRTVHRAGQKLELTAREFDLLEYLMVNHGQVVSREMLARDVWRESSRYTTIDNVIDVQMARLRRKIDEPFTVSLIHTVRGVGFILRIETL